MKTMKLLTSLPRPDAGGAAWPGRLLGLGLLLGLALLLSPAARAQPGSGGPGPGGNPAAQVPLDGGASLLLAGGLGYALRRLRRKQE